MNKFLYITAIIFAFSSHKASASIKQDSQSEDKFESYCLIIDEQMVMTKITIVQDLSERLRKFQAILEEKRKKIENNLLKEKNELDNINQKSAEFNKKFQSFNKKLENYKLKLEQLGKAAEDATKEALAQIDAIFLEGSAEISKKYHNKPIAKLSSFSYVPKHYNNVTGEFIELINKKNLNIKLVLPSINLE